ncbi:MAG: hypothetical protein ACYTBZ_09745 [Planctomycetota bacterium]|jgi:hypothetical protein
MFDTSIDILYLIWQESLVATAVIVICVLVGWKAADVHDRWAVRAVKWWMDHVVYRVLTSPSWLKRTLMIAANNSLICLCAVLLGALGHLAWLAVAGIGFCLGVALHLMIKATAVDRDDRETPISRNKTLTAIGMLLNLLEVPAIMLSAGLSLAQCALTSTIDLSAALSVFGWFAMPMFIIGAAGESLWMGYDPHIVKLWTHTRS